MAAAAFVRRRAPTGLSCNVLPDIVCIQKRFAAGKVDLRAEVLEFEDDLPLNVAASPPVSWFTRRSFHNLEMAAIFNNRWVGIGNIHKVQSKGDYFTGTMGNEPYLVANDGDAVRTFYNVCQHKGALLAPSSSGKAANFTCGNNGRVYGLDGHLLKAAAGEELKDDYATNAAPGQLRRRRHLEPVPCAAWGPVVFAHLKQLAASQYNNSSKEDETVEVSTTLAIGSPPEAGTTLLHTANYAVDSNWKVIIQKYLELVPGFTDEGLVSAYPGEQQTTSALKRLPNFGGDRQQQTQRRQRFYIYPNVIVDGHDEWTAVRHLYPRDANRCVITVDYFASKSAYESVNGDRRARLVNDFVNADRSAMVTHGEGCERVQQAMASKSAAAARHAYIVATDAAVREFHVRLAGDIKESLRLKFDTTI